MRYRSESTVPGANCKASDEGGLEVGDETFGFVPAKVSIWESSADPPQREQNRSAGARTEPQLEQELIPRFWRVTIAYKAFSLANIYTIVNRTARAAASAHGVANQNWRNRVPEAGYVKAQDEGLGE